MKRSLELELKRLRSDYQQVIGQPFDHFFCPFLFKDENVPLCQGHIINIAFSNSSRQCVVQRKDIDNFFGRYFEADFVDLEYHSKLAPLEILGNKKLSKKFKPKITLDDKVCDYYVQNGPVPYNHTMMDVTDGHKTIPIVLKINPLSVVSEKTHNIDFEVYKDVCVAALVSLIKSAHLTLFDIVGYQYALSAGGFFVGKCILGDFFKQNAGRNKQEVIKFAIPYFRKFKNMVRPVKTTSSGFKGTISDKKLLFWQINHRGQ